jgi:rSAM/selenodomain-associated transferase 2
MTEPSRLSIIIPALNEAVGLCERLLDLQGLRAQGHETLVIDGGSSDGTVDIAKPLVDQLDGAERGRAKQMNQGARLARGDILVFLHADTSLPMDAAELICRGLSEQKHVWGRFDVRISGQHPGLRWVATCMNWRSRLSGIATGDQALFVRKEIFWDVGGYPDLPLMEDIALSKRLRTMHGMPLCLHATVTTSGRRWEQHGLLRTILLMWTLRCAYFCGVRPSLLARAYGYVVTSD